MLLMKGFFLCNKMLRLPFGLYLNQQSRNNEKNVLFFFSLFTNGFAQICLGRVILTTRLKMFSQQHKFCSSENALFSKNTTTNVVKTTNTIDGLSGKRFLLYTTAQQSKPCRYENGLILQSMRQMERIECCRYYQ
jgi:hypothetical protein